MSNGEAAVKFFWNKRLSRPREFKEGLAMLQRRTELKNSSLGRLKDKGGDIVLEDGARITPGIKIRGNAKTRLRKSFHTRARYMYTFNVNT